MEFLFLIVAIMAYVTKGICGKKTSFYVKTNNDSYLFNGTRMFICVFVGLIFIISQSQTYEMIRIDGALLLIYIISGLATAMMTFSWVLSVQKGAMVFVDTFMLLSTVIPIVGSAIFYHEAIRINQIIGFVILLLAVIMMAVYNNCLQREKIHYSTWSIFLLTFFGAGFMSFSQKMYTNYALRSHFEPCANIFNFYTYFVSSILFVIAYFATRPRTSVKISTEEVRHRLSLQKNNFIKAFKYIFLMSILLFVNSYMMIKASVLAAAIIYPMQYGLNLILMTFAAYFFFHEKPRGISVGASFLALIGLLIMNLHIF